MLNMLNFKFELKMSVFSEFLLHVKESCTSAKALKWTRVNLQSYQNTCVAAKKNYRTSPDTKRWKLLLRTP